MQKWEYIFTYQELLETQEPKGTSLLLWKFVINGKKEMRSVSSYAFANELGERGWELIATTHEREMVFKSPKQ